MNADMIPRLASNRARCAAACVLLAALGVVPPARAADPATAEALFREGKALLEKGELASACPKLEQSERLDPSSGTMLNLALCHDKQGKSATAWAEYLLAARMARTQGKAERAKAAEQYASALEPKLSYLTITVSSKVPGLIIRRGGTELDESAIGSRLPVDPGEQVLTVSAPGKKTLELKVQLKAGGDAQTVTVPELENETASSNVTAPPIAETSAAPAATSPSEPASDKGKKTPVLGWVIGGVGAAALGVGGVFGAFALSSYDDAEKQCPSHTNCSKAAINKRSSANTQANVANIGVGVGIVGIGIGAILILTGSGGDPTPAKGSLHLTPVAGGSVTGVLVRSVF